MNARAALKKNDVMTNFSPPPSARKFDLAKTYRPIESELKATTEALREALRRSDPAFARYLDYSFELGGKRLRPALLLLSGRAWGAIERRHRLCAAALEMIHTGSLIHDDILDGAKFRRQLETFNAKWDSKRAVLVGDILITLALDMICECDDPVVFRETSAKCRATVEGELFQTDSSGNFELTVEDYRRIVLGKTASLIECSTFLGGYLSGARDAELELFATFGRSRSSTTCSISSGTRKRRARRSDPISRTRRRRCRSFGTLKALRSLTRGGSAIGSSAGFALRNGRKSRRFCAIRARWTRRLRTRTG